MDENERGYYEGRLIPASDVPEPKLQFEVGDIIEVPFGPGIVHQARIVSIVPNDEPGTGGRIDAVVESYPGEFDDGVGDGEGQSHSAT